MTYLQPHRRPYQQFARFGAVIVGVIVLACVVIIIFAPHLFSAVFTSMARPFWRMEFSAMSGSLKSPERLLAENEELRNRLTDLELSSETIDFVLAENQELKTLLGRGNDVQTSTSSEYMAPIVDGVLAAVLKRPPVSPYDEIIIDVGRDYTISTSSLIYAVGNVLIGRVVDVLGTTSKVRLFSSPGERYEVLIGTSNTPATAIGRGGGQYEAQVSREAGVRESDFVTNPSVSQRPFAQVTAVLSDPTQPFETVIFAPMVNIYQLKWVIVR
ncbi:MAG: rod shape-determining protein MreC [Patescibacteria group bacterium]